MTYRLVFLTLLLAGVFQANAQSFMYWKDGEKIDFEVVAGNRLVMFDPSLDEGKRIEYRNRLAELVGVENVNELTPVLLEARASDTFIKEWRDLLEDDSLRVNVACALRGEDGGLQYCSNRMFVKADSQTALVSLLNRENVPYSEIATFWCSENVFVVSVPGFEVRTLEYSNRLMETGEVDFAQPNFWRFIKPSNPHYGDQWGLVNTGQYGGLAGMDINISGTSSVSSAWYTSTGSNVKVAVLDEGVDITHTDLINNMLPGYDATDGMMAGDNGACASGDGHGTACAGIIAAGNNGIGVKGVAYDAKIIPIRIAYGVALSDGEREMCTSDDWIVSGICEAWTNRGADVLLCSWEGGTRSWVVEAALLDAVYSGRSSKGCVVVFPSGNAKNPDDPIDSRIRPLGGMRNNSLVVGAMSPCGERKSFTSCDGESSWASRYGNHLDIVAPGVFISTTDNQGNGGYNAGTSDYSDLAYTKWFGGSSAASAHVAGVAALMIAAYPGITAAEVYSIIKSTAQKVRPDLYDYIYESSWSYGTRNNEVGHGLINASLAVRSALMLPYTTLDVFIRDNMADNGTEPNATTTTFFDSPDIWLTNPNGNVVDNPVCGQPYTLHVRVHNRSAYTSSGASLSLRWRTCAASPCWRDGWFNTSPFHGSPTSGAIAQVSLGPIPAGQHAEYTVAWTAPSFQSNSYIPQAGDTQPLSVCALLDDGNPVPGIDANARPMADFARQSNNVAWKRLTLTFDPHVWIEEPLIPILGAPATLTGGSSEADAQLTWRGADGTVLGTGETLAIVPSAATERYILEGYSPSLDACGSDTLTLHPRLGAILSVSPNPAAGQTEVACRLSPVLAGATLLLTNTVGLPVLAETVTPAADGTASCTLPLHGVPAGQYQLRLTAGTQLIDARTLVVR